MHSQKEQVKVAFLKAMDIKIKSLEMLDDNSYIINNTYRLTKGDNFINSIDDVKIMYAFFEQDKYCEKLVAMSDGYYILKNIHRKEIKTNLDENDLYLITKVIKKIHKKETYDFLPKFNLDEFIEKIGVKINKNTLRKYRSLFLKIQEKEGLVISHNNLDKANILFGYDDVVVRNLFNMNSNIVQYDLASTIYTFKMNDDQIDFFLRKYYGKKYSSLKRSKVISILKLISLIKKQDN